LSHYLKDEAEQEIPVWRMISAPLENLHDRAGLWVKSFEQGEVIAGLSTVGGGSLPEEMLPTYLAAFHTRSPDRMLARLRRCDPPVIARLENDRLVLDPRTVLPEQDQALIHALKSVFQKN
jgi:L-seryl-tRNA(Ser) seleniumtransferase